MYRDTRNNNKDVSMRTFISISSLHASGDSECSISLRAASQQSRCEMRSSCLTDIDCSPSKNTRVAANWQPRARTIGRGEHSSANSTDIVQSTLRHCYAPFILLCVSLLRALSRALNEQFEQAHTSISNRRFRKDLHQCDRIVKNLKSAKRALFSLLSLTSVIVWCARGRCTSIAVALTINAGTAGITSTTNATNTILGNQDFTFQHNGSFLKIDAGREWPFNSKREISFRFKTKSHHGLLMYQTFDHNKLTTDDTDSSMDSLNTQLLKTSDNEKASDGTNMPQAPPNSIKGSHVRTTSKFRRQIKQRSIKNLVFNHDLRENYPDAALTLLNSKTITASASEKLVNSLFSASPVAAINGNDHLARNLAKSAPREKLMAGAANLPAMFSSDRTGLMVRSHLLNDVTETSANRIKYDARNSLTSDSTDSSSSVLSSSTLSTLSASLNELYIKLENGRLKIMYEFGSRLNQTYCGKGLNDDRWHQVDLKVDPEANRIAIVLDQVITVEIVFNQPQQDEETVRGGELVFTNSVLYLGGLNKNASYIKNVRQRLYLAQFIGCLGQIYLKSDQQVEISLQPAILDETNLVQRGCLNLCDSNNYCLNNSTCVNHYTHTSCDCFGTKFESVYCWQKNLTTLSMFGYSTLIYRIYDWRDRHHSSINKLSLRFKTYALNSIIFFAYGDLSAQQIFKSSINVQQQQAQPTSNNMAPFQVNFSSSQTIQRASAYPYQGLNNYLAVSLSNGSLVVEVNFGDQPILLSNILYERIRNESMRQDFSNLHTLNDGLWHNITLSHSSRHISLYLDDASISVAHGHKNYHLYFDPSIYIGSVPNFMLNETRALLRPFNLRHKFVGCLESVYFNQHNVLLALKQNLTNVEYRDQIGRPHFDACTVLEPRSLPLTLQSGKSYLIFQLSPSVQNPNALISKSMRSDNITAGVAPIREYSGKEMNSTRDHAPIPATKKITQIDFEYKTLLKTHFLAGGHLRDLKYHDLGGFWTMHAQDDCQLCFTISLGLTFEPEKILEIKAHEQRCEPGVWYRISLAIVSGASLNITRTKVQERPTDPVFHQNYELNMSVELLHHVQLGGDLAKFGETSSIPFSGCFRRIIINGQSFDARDFATSSPSSTGSTATLNQQSSISTTTPDFKSAMFDLVSGGMAQGNVKINSCSLVNQCITSNPCENGGVCRISEMGEPECDCSKTGYTGKRCHFSIYKSSCLDLYLGGHRKSAFYLIDVDRNGPLKAIRVRCNMGSDGYEIETSLQHNLPADFLIRRSTNDIALDITYLAFHHLYTYDGFYTQNDDDENARITQDIMLRYLIGQSTYCHQYFRYDCKSAPLFLGNETWLEVPYPKRHKLKTMDGINDGLCACATAEKKCLDPSKMCNCDSDEPNWSDDSYEFTKNNQVGIARITLLKQDENQESDYVDPQSRITLSGLKCYATKHDLSQPEITFKTSDAFIEVPGWRRGDISFSFRTASNPPAIVLYQIATSRNHGYFRLTLVTDTRLLFEYIVNRRPRRLQLSSSHKLNNGEWQQVFIEYDSANLRLTVNDDSAMVDLDIGDHLGTFEGPMYIGGAPSKYLIGDLSKRNGFTGCFRGLTINERSVELNSYLSPLMPTVVSGCKPSCTNNLCQNKAKCIEYWGSYECECSNPIAHSGPNCEININTNSITFVSQEAYYVQDADDSLSFPPYLVKNILLSVRTYQETALILYAHDRYNNFIQLHKNDTNLILTFNSNATIVSTRIPIAEELNPDSAIMKINPTTFQEAFTPHPQIILTQNDTSLNNSTSQTNTTNKNLLAVNGNQSYNLQKSIKFSNTSGSGQPIQIKIERHRLRTTFYVNNRYVVIEKPLILQTNNSQNSWIDSDMDIVRPNKMKIASKTQAKIFLANIGEQFSTRLPGFTGCVQGFSIDNQLLDFNRAHLIGEFKGAYRLGCKMHCDSMPCKNQGTCIENWLEDKIHCKCETTSFVGKLCDEDIAAIFNGYSSRFVYNLTKRSTKQQELFKAINKIVPVIPASESNTLNQVDAATQTQSQTILQQEANSLHNINLMEVSLAFSSDLNQTSTPGTPSVQVLVLITYADSSKHFFLGLTADGSLHIQEDYGNSMSLSRLIKKQDQTGYIDGHRHMVKYSRYNQTIQIFVDHRTYLPTMNVVTANRINRHFKDSLVYVGTAKQSESDDLNDMSKSNYTNYNGCISNLFIKMNDLVVEPFNEAFGQNLGTIDLNTTSTTTSIVNRQSTSSINNEKHTESEVKKNRAASSMEPSEIVTSAEDFISLQVGGSAQQIARYSKTNNEAHKEVEREDLEKTDIIMVRDVEQGTCAVFKRAESMTDKRSVNEPRFISLIDPRPVYMDPPRMKVFKRTGKLLGGKVHSDGGFDYMFYVALTFLVVVLFSCTAYAYVLQVRYKSEKFRSQTPFFHRRDGNSPTPVSGRETPTNRVNSPLLMHSINQRRQ